MPENAPPPAVLVFAPSDPSGGSGLQAGLVTIHSLGCHALSVVTAITVQDTAGVEEVHPLDADWIAAQARRVLEDVPVAAILLSMLATPEIVSTVAEIAVDYPNAALIVDPKLTYGRGDEVQRIELADALRELIIPQATVLVISSHELARLTANDDDEDQPNMAELTSRILSTGCEYMLVTGSREITPKIANTLYHEKGIVRRDEWERLPGAFHGAGCTLAAALAACIARGLDIDDACLEAQEFTMETLRAAYRIGMGQPVPDRMFWAQDIEEEATEPTP